MGYSESISAHTAMTTTENSGHDTQRAFLTLVFGDVNCASGCVLGTCTMHRAKHAQGDCVWITQGIDLHPLRASRPPVPQLLDHRHRIHFPGVTLPLLRVFVQPCLLPVTQLLEHCLSFPLDMLERFLFCLGHFLAGHQKDCFLLVMALQLCRLRRVHRSQHSTLANATIANGGQTALVI